MVMLHPRQFCLRSNIIIQLGTGYHIFDALPDIDLIKFCGSVSYLVALSVTRSIQKGKESNRLKKTHNLRIEIIFLKEKEIFPIQTNFIVDSFETNGNKREKELV